MRKGLRADRDLVLIVLSLALVLRVYFAIAFDSSISAGYGADFVRISGNVLPLAEGAPKYAILLKWLLSLSGGNLTPVFLVNAILGTAAVAMLYFGGTVLCSRRAGLIAALVAAIYPGFVLSTLSPTPASPVIFICSALILLMAAGSISGRRTDAIPPITGLIVSAGILLEPVMAFLVPGLIAVSRSRLILILAIATVVLPLTMSHSIFERKFVPLYKPVYWRVDIDKYHGDKLSGGWRPVSKIYENAAFITDRGWSAGSEAADGRRRDSTYATGYSYIALLILGLLGIARRFRRRHLQVLLPFLVYFVLLVLLTVFEIKYRIVLEPLFVLYAGILLGGKCQTDQAAKTAEAAEAG